MSARRIRSARGALSLEARGVAPISARAALAEIFRAAVAAVDPAKLVRERLTRRGASLVLEVGGRTLRRPVARLWVAAVGKAAPGMLRGLGSIAPEVPGVAIVPPGAAGRLSGSRIRCWTGSHPVPDRATFRATSALRRALAALPADATVLFLLSGGASSLLAAPAAGLRPRDEVDLGRWLLRSGLPIDAMNAIRKHTSAVKGGGILALVHPREVITLILSDVPGNDVATIGSGPTAPDPTTYDDALAAVARAAVPAALPKRVRRHLEAGAAGERAETLKPGDPRLKRARAAVIGSNETALAAAAAWARGHGYAVRGAGPLAGEAREAAARFVASLPAAPRRPTCVLAGGETTVAVRGGKGRGGRSQELALAAAIRLPAGWSLLAAGTDGVDGRTPAAGAFADAAVRRLGRKAVGQALGAHDSYRLLGPAGHLLVTGPTGTNVGDLVIALHQGR